MRPALFLAAPFLLSLTVAAGADQTLDYAQGLCRAYGYQPSSAGYADCVMGVDQQQRKNQYMNRTCQPQPAEIGDCSLQASYAGGNYFQCIQIRLSQRGC